MRTPLRFLLQERKVKGLEEGFEQWKQDHDEAMLAYDAEALVRECIKVAKDAKEVWDEAKPDLGKVPSDKLDDLGRTIDRLFTGTTRVLTKVRECALGVSQTTGHVIAGLGELSELVRVIGDMHARIMRNWPWDNELWPPIDRAMQQRARSGQDGPGEDIKDILHRVQAGGPIA